MAATDGLLGKNVLICALLPTSRRVYEAMDGPSTMLILGFEDAHRAKNLRRSRLPSACEKKKNQFRHAHKQRIEGWKVWTRSADEIAWIRPDGKGCALRAMNPQLEIFRVAPGTSPPAKTIRHGHRFEKHHFHHHALHSDGGSGGARH